MRKYRGTVLYGLSGVRGPIGALGFDEDRIGVRGRTSWVPWVWWKRFERASIDHLRVNVGRGVQVQLIGEDGPIGRSRLPFDRRGIMFLRLFGGERIAADLRELGWIVDEARGERRGAPSLVVNLFEDQQGLVFQATDRMSQLSHLGRSDMVRVSYPCTDEDVLTALTAALLACRTPNLSPDPRAATRARAQLLEVLGVESDGVLDREVRQVRVSCGKHGWYFEPRGPSDGEMVVLSDQPAWVASIRDAELVRGAIELAFARAVLAP